MVVCHCFALNDAAISEVVDSGLVDVDAVVEACGAGSKCGGCRPLIEEVLQQLVTKGNAQVVSIG